VNPCERGTLRENEPETRAFSIRIMPVGFGISRENNRSYHTAGWLILVFRNTKLFEIGKWRNASASSEV
jgi:hypothetical protein